MRLISVIVFLVVFALAGYATEDYQEVDANKPGFNSGWIQLRLSYGFPLGNISDAYNSYPSGGVSLILPYWNFVRVDVGLDYTRHSTELLPVEIHSFRGRAGFAANSWFGGVGTGVTLTFLRTVEESGENLLMDDNESDFGWYFLGTTPALRIGIVDFSVGSLLSSTFTLPERTWFAEVYLQGEIKLW